MQRFTFEKTTDTYPTWHSNGKEIFFYRVAGNTRSVLRKDASGAGVEKILFQNQGQTYPGSVSPDGRWMAAHTTRPNLDVGLLRLDGKAEYIPVENSSASERYPVFSPDGRWIAYQSDETGIDQVFIRSIPEVMGGPKDRGKWQISTDGGANARWRKDGKELFFTSPSGQIMSVDIASTPTAIQGGTPKALFATRSTSPIYDVTPDGQRFLVAEPVQNSEPPFTVILNWESLLNKSNRGTP